MFEHGQNMKNQRLPAGEDTTCAKVWAVAAFDHRGLGGYESEQQDVGSETKGEEQACQT